MISMVERNKVFHEFLTADSSSISIKYIIDKSYAIKKRCCLQDIPDEIKMKYDGEFEHAIMLDAQKGKTSGHWILFPNGDALLTQMTNNYQLAGYEFNELVTIEKKKTFGDSDFYSFKLFDQEGRMIENPGK